MARRTDAHDEDTKTQALRNSGTLHAHPEKVVDPLFRESEFFDPRDLVMVKYEMLRRVQAEGISVAQAASAFGFTRPVFYHALASLQSEGLPGLIPKRPGPKGRHKLSDEVIAYLDQLLAVDAELRSGELVQRVLGKFGLNVHARSIERALRRRKKTG